jgi:hypothetical protein
LQLFPEKQPFGLSEVFFTDISARSFTFAEFATKLDLPKNLTRRHAIFRYTEEDI